MSSSTPRGRGRPRSMNDLSEQKISNQRLGDRLEDQVADIRRRQAAMELAVTPHANDAYRQAAVGPYPGQPVWYTLQEVNPGEVRGAVILRVIDPETAAVSLRVFTDPSWDKHVTEFEPKVNPGRGVGQWFPMIPGSVQFDEDNHAVHHKTISDDLGAPLKEDAPKSSANTKETRHGQKKGHINETVQTEDAEG